MIYPGGIADPNDEAIQRLQKIIDEAYAEIHFRRLAKKREEEVMGSEDEPLYDVFVDAPKDGQTF